MRVLVGLETLLLAFLTLLVGGLLRSHAEISRRLASTPLQVSQPGSLPTSGVSEAVDVIGVDLEGHPARVSVHQPGTLSLLAFLSSGCGTCADFWREFREGRVPSMPGDPQVILVSKDRTEENHGKLRELAPTHLPVVMSTVTWEAYNVPMNPYFMLVDGSRGRIIGEGAASSWSQVLSLIGDALADYRGILSTPPAHGGIEAETESRSVTPTGGPPLLVQREPSWRQENVDAILKAAGIGPGHPSLHDPLWGSDESLSEDEGGGGEESR